MVRVFFCLFAVAVISGVTGCSRANRLAEIEARERGSSLFRKARAAELAGNLDEAIQFLNRVLEEAPKDFSAHFQLATLLHDHAQDYIGAIYHYKRYLALRPESEKSTLAQDRVRVAEQLLAPQILKKVGDSVEGISQVHLLKEVEKLNRQIASLVGEKSTLLEEKSKQDAERKTLVADNERLRSILDKMRAETIVTPVEKKALPKKDTASVAPVRKPVPRREKAVHADTSLTPSELQRLRAEAAELSSATAAREKEAGEVSPPPPAAEVQTNAPSISSLFKRGKKSRAAKAPGEMRTYVVQPGDSLFRVSEKFYGVSTQWKKIRDANRANIDPDGRIRAGQIIVVP